MNVKMLWRRMTAGMTAVLMLAITQGDLATAAEMISEDAAAAQTEDAALVYEDLLPGNEAVLETAEEDILEETVEPADSFSFEAADEELIVDPETWMEDEVFIEDAQTSAAGTGYIEFTTAEEISADESISVPTNPAIEGKWYKFVVPKSGYYQCDMTFPLPEGAGEGAAWVSYYDSSSMYLNGASIEVFSDVSVNKGYIYLYDQETIYLQANGYASNEMEGVFDIPGNFNFVISEAGEILPEDAHREEDEDYFEVWNYDGKEFLEVSPNTEVTLVAGWAAYGDRQPVFMWESFPYKLADEGNPSAGWTVDYSKPSTVLSSTTDQATVTAPSVIGEVIGVDLTATLDGKEAHTWFMIKVCEDAHQPGDEGPTGEHTHQPGNWVKTADPTALAEGTQVRTCKLCGQVLDSRPIPKLPAFIVMNVAANNTIPLKVKQATTKIKVTALQTGDRVKSWTSSKPEVATVDANGKIQGKKKGTAVITVTTASNLTYSFKIKVQKPKVATKKIIIESPENLTLKKKQKAKIDVQLLPITTLDKISYKTSDKKVAIVKKGFIIAKSKGKAKITVKAGKKEITIKVKVTK